MIWLNKIMYHLSGQAGRDNARHRREAEERSAWEQERRAASRRYDEIYERLKDEEVDFGVLPEKIRNHLVALFANDGYRISLWVGGFRGINADMYFMWRSGTTTTLFTEKQYGTEQFIRMTRAAHAYASALLEKRDAALRKLVEDMPA